MKKVKKYFFPLILTITILIIFGIAKLFVLQPNISIYDYVPIESDIVVELNLQNFSKELSYQKLYESQNFNDKESNFDAQSKIELLKESGINPLSKTILFREKWADENIWFAIIKTVNQSNFKKFIEAELQHAQIFFNNDIAIIQLNKSNNQSKIQKHIDAILSKSINNIQQKIDLKNTFLPNNELNIYLKANKSDFITDGFIHLNFEKNKIKLEGNLIPVGTKNSVNPIAYKVDKSKALSLRSSLNLFKKIYLFQNTKLDSLPNYTQLAVDYDGATLATVNEFIPIKTYPKINLQVDIDSKEEWQEYIKKMAENKTFNFSNDTIIIESQGKVFLLHKLSEKNFKIFQKENKFESSESDTTFLDLYIEPTKIVEQTFFKKDEKNPPKMFANLKISAIQSFIEEFDYLKDINYIQFSITRKNDKENYISNGEIVFNAKEGHSIIESLILTQKFIDTFGSFIEFN